MPAKRNRIMIIIIAICAVLIVVLACALFFIRRSSGNTPAAEKAENKVVVERESETDVIDNSENGEKDNSENAEKDNSKNRAKPTAGLIMEEREVSANQLPDGYYTIASALDNSVMIHPGSSSDETGSRAELWDTGDLSNEIYYFELQSDGYYKIINVNLQQALDVKDASEESGAILQHRDYDGSKGQKWVLTSDDGGHMKIESALGTCLDCAEGAHVNGTEILLVEENGGLNQKWDLYRNGVFNPLYGVRAGDYKIATSLNLNKVIEPANSEYENDTQIVLSDIGDGAQLYHIEMQMDGYYEILTADRTKSVSVKDASAENGAKLTLNEYSASPNQQWSIDITEDGYYSVSSSLGTYMDDAKSSLENGNEILLCDFNANPNQKWALLPEGIQLGDMYATAVSGVYSEGTAQVPEKVESGLYQITSAMDDEKALHIVDESDAEGSELEILYKQRGTEYFTFFIGDNEDGTYRITSDAAGGLSLDVMDASPESGAHLQMRKYDATTGQRWIIVPSAEGTRYVIKSELGTCLDIDYASAEDGTHVNMYQVTEAENQLWNLHRIG